METIFVPFKKQDSNLAIACRDEAYLETLNHNLTVVSPKLAYDWECEIMTKLNSIIGEFTFNECNSWEEAYRTVIKWASNYDEYSLPHLLPVEFKIFGDKAGVEFINWGNKDMFVPKQLMTTGLIHPIDDVKNKDGSININGWHSFILAFHPA